MFTCTYLHTVSGSLDSTGQWRKCLRPACMRRSKVIYTLQNRIDLLVHTYSLVPKPLLFPYSKRQKAGRGLGTRLTYIHVHVLTCLQRGCNYSAIAQRQCYNQSCWRNRVWTLSLGKLGPVDIRQSVIIGVCFFFFSFSFTWDDPVNEEIPNST